MTTAAHNMDPRNYLYHSLSHVIHSNAIFPPKIGKDFNHFDIVLINPDGPKGSMLEETDANLFEVLTEDEKQKLNSSMQTHTHDGEKHLSSINNWHAQGKIHIKNGLATLGPQISFNSGQIVDLAIVDAKTTGIKYRITRTIEKFIFKYFPKLIATAIGRHVKKRFFIGVITGVTTGKIDAISEQVRNVAANTSVGTGVPVDGRTTVQGTVENRRQLFGNGIIGVDVVSFLIKTNPETCEYKVSRGIRAMHINNDKFTSCRKYLRGGRGFLSVVGITRKSKDLFAACNIASPEDLNDNPDMKEEYVKLTTEFGKILGREYLMRESEEFKLLADFGGVMGRDLWSKDVTQPPEMSLDPLDVSPYLIINGLDKLNEINEDDDIPWMNMPSCTIVADASRELPKMATD